MRHHLSSERLLRGGKRGAGVCGDVATKGTVRDIKRLLLIKENQILQFKEFSTVFTYGKLPESGLPEIIPLMCTSALWGWDLVFPCPESFLRAQSRAGLQSGGR